jgi:hypothetical protein
VTSPRYLYSELVKRSVDNGMRESEERAKRWMIVVWRVDGWLEVCLCDCEQQKKELMMILLTPKRPNVLFAQRIIVKLRKFLKLILISTNATLD